MSSNNNGNLYLFKSELQRIDKKNDTRHREFAERVAKRHGLKDFREVLEIYELCYNICMDLCRILGVSLRELKYELEKYIPMDPVDKIQRKFGEFVESIAEDPKKMRELNKVYGILHRIYIQDKPFEQALFEVFNEITEKEVENVE